MSERAHTKGRERPILFSAPMVRALIDGRKTQTRRILGQLDVFRRDDGTEAPVSCLQIEGEPLPRVTIGNVVTLKKLKAAIGDRLWVRESGQLLREAYEHEPGVGDLWRDAGFYHSADGEIVAARSYDTPIREWIDDCARINRPSIHMPRWASRLTLTVTDVRVQRLQEISEEDARAEGVEPIVDHGVGNQHLHRIAFDQLWDRIHGAGATYANPWVAAYTFTVERRNIDEGLGQRADAIPSNPLSEGRER